MSLLSSFACSDPSKTPDKTPNGDSTSEPGFVISDVSNKYVVERGSPVTLTVALSTAPTNDLVVEVTSSDITEALVSPSMLTFTAANWNLPQTVNVNPVDDWEVDERKL